MERQLIRLGGTAALLSTDGSRASSTTSGDEAAGPASVSSTPLRNIIPTLPSYKQDSAQFIGIEKDDGLPPKDIIMHLVGLYFKYINATFPIVHRQTLMKSIEDGTVSKPLLWSVLAIGARYSDDPSIKTDPPYWAGERFAAKAQSLIDGSLLEPTLPNLQFWHIMACLEYGRASGAKAWIYAGLAVRFCQELGLNKEETLTTPILSKDGTIDTVAMALRRRIFWSCFCIDKFASAGTSRPQGFLKTDIDANPPNIPESLVIRDPHANISVSKKHVVSDSLMDVGRHFMKVMQLFGEGNSIMSRTRSDSSSIVWPPVPEYTGLDTNLRVWKDNLPERFQFTPANLDFHKDNASSVYFTMWLSMHAVWCSSLMVLHRGSLAYGDIRAADVDQDVYRAIQLSIETCKMSVRTATGVFRAMRDLCGCNVLPYMGYSAYVFATVLMTSTFSKGADQCRRSSAALKVLYDLIDVSSISLFIVLLLFLKKET
ncbi:fungal-specific transcription factor domain-containing protein [Dichotomocladium elegans]|nr:fungal-specific transcription factor domain-containing protein [Dichotomocladium elegans]